MKIQELFLKPVDRFIEGVIHADDERYIHTELSEYVVTQDVAKGLGIFTERYLSETSSNGVWISGFFGSGKSHLLKILSLCLDNESLPNGARSADILLPKIKDEIVRADFRKATAIPSRSILFNIDQKFDGIGGDHSAPILEVFAKVLNELQGYFGKQGYIAKFERDLDLRGEFHPFKETYLRVNGTTWEADREALSTARAAEFGKAYAEHFGVPEAEASRSMQQTREDYKLSIEGFARMVKDYISLQPAGFRLSGNIGFLPRVTDKRLSFSPNGELLAVAEGKEIVKLLDPLTGIEFNSIHLHDAKVANFSFAAHGEQLVISSDDGTIRTFRTSTGRPLKKFHDHPEGTLVDIMEVSSDGITIASASAEDTPGPVAVRNLSTKDRGIQLQPNEIHDEIKGISFSPRGDRLAFITLDGDV